MDRNQERARPASLGLAIEEARRSEFFAELDAAYAELRADPEEWKKFELELKTWEGMKGGLADGSL